LVIKSGIARTDLLVQESAREIAEASGEEAPLGLGRGKLDGPAVGRSGCLAAAKSAQKVGPGGVQQVVVAQRRVVEAVDEGQPGRRSLGHRDRHSPVEQHDRGRRDLGEPVIERGDLGRLRSALSALGVAVAIAALVAVSALPRQPRRTCSLSWAARGTC
jgi:hypothetical protein